MRSPLKKSGLVGSIATVLASIAVAIFMVALSARRKAGLNTVETSLFNVLILGLGLSGSYFFGRVSSQLPNARSAFRRLVSLYASMGRFLETIETRREVLRSDAVEGRVSLDRALDTLDVLDVQIREKLQTVDDAVADWRDVAPDTVADLELGLKRNKESQQR